MANAHVMQALAIAITIGHPSMLLSGLASGSGSPL